MRHVPGAPRVGGPTEQLDELGPGTVSRVLQALMRLRDEAPRIAQRRLPTLGAIQRCSADHPKQGKRWGRLD